MEKNNMCYGIYAGIELNKKSNNNNSKIPNIFYGFDVIGKNGLEHYTLEVTYKSFDVINVGQPILYDVSNNKFSIISFDELPNDILIKIIKYYISEYTNKKSMVRTDESNLLNNRIKQIEEVLESLRKLNKFIINESKEKEKEIILDNELPQQLKKEKQMNKMYFDYLAQKFNLYNGDLTGEMLTQRKYTILLYLKQELDKYCDENIVFSENNRIK